MTLLDQITKVAGLVLQGSYRTVYPAGVEIDEQILNLRRRHSRVTTWDTPSIQESLGVPAIFGAVSLIANTVGSLSLEAFREGNLLSDRQQIPRLIVRPNPFSTPRTFFRDTAYYLATRGEAWWWIAARDTDDAPMSLYPIPPWEITVAGNERNRLRPTITWGNRVMPNEDIRHITYLPDHAGLRGVGPMQLCGAAMSVTVESQEWAANFFSGALPSIIGTTEQDMSEDEMKALDAQWNEKAPNTPRWMTNGLKLEVPPFDADRAQLTEQRQHQVGEAARMFSMPGALIEYQMGGSSLTYQNQEDIWQDFQRRCLSPHYLEPIEQEISDLLTRATVARFNLKQLLRASVKTRMEVHQIAIETGVYDAATAAREEGYAPGSVDFAPVPLALPQATPNLLPINRSAEQVRCSKCGKIHGFLSAPYSFTCHRCKTLNTADAPVDQLALMRSMQPPAPHIEIHNHPPPQSSITFERDAFHFDAPEPAEPPTVNVSVAAPPAPVVNVKPSITLPEQKVHMRVVERSAPQVTVTTPDTQRVEITAMPDRLKVAKRTTKGQIEAMLETDGR